MAQTLEAIYRGDGCVIDYTPGSDVAAGTVVVQNGLIGVATRAISANVKGSLRVCGLFRLKKKSGDVFAAGQNVFWDDPSNNEATTTDTGLLFGKAATAAASGDDYVDALLCQPEIIST